MLFFHGRFIGSVVSFDSVHGLERCWVHRGFGPLIRVAEGTPGAQLVCPD